MPVVLSVAIYFLPFLLPVFSALFMSFILSFCRFLPPLSLSLSLSLSRVSPYIFIEANHENKKLESPEVPNLHRSIPSAYLNALLRRSRHALWLQYRAHRWPPRALRNRFWAALGVLSAAFGPVLGLPGRFLGPFWVVQEIPGSSGRLWE